MMKELLAQRFIHKLPYGYVCAKLVFDGLGQAVDSEIFETNAVFEKICGQEAGALAGKRLSEVLAMLLPAGFEAGLFYRTLAKVGNTKIDALGPDRSGRWYHFDAFLLDEINCAIILRDISEQKKTLEELKKQKRALETAYTDLSLIFNSTQDAMFVAEYTEDAFRYLRINAAHQEISGLRDEDIRGKTPEEVWGRETGRRLHDLYSQGMSSPDGLLFEEELELNGKTHYFLNGMKSAHHDGRQYLISSRKDITKFKELQEDHLALLQRLQAMFNDHLAIMLVIDPQTGRILDVNPAACDFYGYARAELLSLNIQEINMLPPAETARLRKQAYERREGHFIFPHRLKNGEIRLVEVYSSPFGSEAEPQLYSIIFDVTDREMYRESLFREKEILNTTLRSIGDGVVTTDNTGGITFINKAAEAILRQHGEEVQGKAFSNVFILKNEITGAPVEDPVEKVLRTGRMFGLENHTALINREGEEISIADSAAPIKNEKGEIFGAVIVFRDVRHERARQEEILFLSYHDALTSLYNRRFIESEIHRLDESMELPVSVIMGDVNGLKIANDIFSHETGDLLLKRVSEVFSECAGEKDIVARWGGDEFLMLLPGISQERAEEMIRRLKECFLQKSEGTLQLSVSLGCAEKTEKAQRLSAIIRQAEEWMYHQKLLEGKSYRNTVISTLLATLYEKSMETEEHAHRLMKYCQAIGARLHFSDKAMNELSLLAVLHDIGKVGIQEDVLKKPGQLSPEEWKEMKKHPEIGYRIAQNTPELSQVAEYILCHHERWDGKGYPNGLKDNHIPLNCRILAVVDAFDAMTNDRIYRRALSRAEAAVELAANAGTQFDPEIVAAFLDILHKEDESLCAAAN